MNEVTRILSAIDQGDPQAAEQLLPVVYDALRKLAGKGWRRRNPGRHCRPRPWFTRPIFALWRAQHAQRWDSRGHFFAAAAEAMRRILLNGARDKKRIKRGGERHRVDLDQIEIALDTGDDQA